MVTGPQPHALESQGVSFSASHYTTTKLAIEYFLEIVKG